MDEPSAQNDPETTDEAKGASGDQDEAASTDEAVTTEGEAGEAQPGQEATAEGEAEGEEGEAEGEEGEAEGEEEEEEKEEVPWEVRKEVAIGGTEAGIATNNAIRSLSRTARSFLLYEPRNQAIRDFLADFRENMNAALEAHGTMALDIRPFEMMRGEEVVYLERDRERSLAFRLFRDGVRRLTIEPTVEWRELLRLLEILSIRYTGIRQQEDDIVTLLWKAGFKNIGIVAIEGFVPEEEMPQGGWSTEMPSAKKRRRKKKTSMHIDAPPDFDLPLPVTSELGTLTYREVPESRLAELVAETSSKNMPQLAVHLVARLLDVAADATDPMTLQVVLPLIGEVRDFLLSEGQLGTLNALVRAMEQRRPVDIELMDQEMAAFADTRALKRILGSVGKGTEDIPPEMLELLEMIPADHLNNLMDLLIEERGVASRRITRMLIERFIVESPDPSYVFERMVKQTPGVLCDILRAVSHALPDEVFEHVEELATHASSEVQLEVLWVLRRSDDEEGVGRIMLRMLNSNFTDVRIRVLEYLETYGTVENFDRVKTFVEHNSTRKISNRECEIAGRVMGLVDADRAEKIFTEWIKPPGFFKRFVELPGTHALHWTSVSGLALVQGKKPDKTIRWLSERCGEDLYKHCMKILVHRRKGGMSSG